MVEALQDPVGPAAPHHHVVDPAHGQQQDAEDGIDAEEHHTAAIAPAPAQEPDAEYQEDNGPQQMGDDAEGFTKARQVIEVCNLLRSVVHSGTGY
jgi:hypothetical protein